MLGGRPGREGSAKPGADPGSPQPGPGSAGPRAGTANTGTRAGKAGWPSWSVGRAARGQWGGESGWPLRRLAERRGERSSEQKGPSTRGQGAQETGVGTRSAQAHLRAAATRPGQGAQRWAQAAPAAGSQCPGPRAAGARGRRAAPPSGLGVPGQGRGKAASWLHGAAPSWGRDTSGPAGSRGCRGPPTPGAWPGSDRHVHPNAALSPPHTAGEGHTPPQPHGRARAPRPASAPAAAGPARRAPRRTPPPASPSAAGRSAVAGRRPVDPRDTSPSVFHVCHSPCVCRVTRLTHARRGCPADRR